MITNYYISGTVTVKSCSKCMPFFLGNVLPLGPFGREMLFKFGPFAGYVTHYKLFECFMGQLNLLH